MQCGFRLRNYKITKLQNRSRGYMLITLMLALALITMALLTVLPDIAQQIKRDREEELRHRGTSYMRAVRNFYKKFGRYPTKVEDLENTNNMRFLRKRYTDPVNRDPATGKEREFKFLHQQDISMNGMSLGQTPTPGLLGGAPGTTGGVLNTTGNGLGTQPGAFGSQPGGGQPGGGATTPTTAGGDSDNSSDKEGDDSSGSGSKSGMGGLNGPTFGGGPIIGVASTSKAKTIRVFYEKDHYKDWLFIYVSQMERGGLPTGPVNPNMQQTGIGGAGAGFTSPQGQGAMPTNPQTPVQPAPPQTPAQTPPE